MSTDWSAIDRRIRSVIVDAAAPKVALLRVDERGKLAVLCGTRPAPEDRASVDNAIAKVIDRLVLLDATEACLTNLTNDIFDEEADDR